MSKPCPVNFYNNSSYNESEIAIINAHHNAAVEYLSSKGVQVNIPTPTGFTNRVFENNVQLGTYTGIGHLSEVGYNYRVLSQTEIESIQNTGGVYAREGKQKGGNVNTKYWTKGNNTNWYGDKEGLETIRVKQENFQYDKVVKAEDLEVYNKETGVFESLVMSETIEVPTESNETNTATVDTTISALTLLNNKYNANVATFDETGAVIVDMSIVADTLLDNNLINLSKSAVRTITSPETLNTFSSKLERLQQAIPNVEVILDETINSKGQVAKENGKQVIRINPNEFTSDTLVHEFGHLYIDILIADGYSSLIENGIKQLRNTPLWDSVAEAYPELDEVTLGKEVLATAIGMESVELDQNITDKSILGSIKSILDSIFRALARLIGIEQNVARELARQLLTNKVLANNTNLLLDFQTYHSKKTQDDLIKLVNYHTTRIIRKKIDGKNRTVFEDGSVSIVSSQSVTKKVSGLHDFEATDVAEFAAKRNLNIPDGVVITTEMRMAIDEEAARIQDTWVTGAAIGTNIHKLFEDVFNLDTTLSDIKSYFTANVEGNTVSDEYVNTFKEQFYKLVAVARNIKSRHPGGVFYTEYKIMDISSDEPVTGVIDVLVVNPDGTFSIYDFKTSTRPVYETVNGRKKLTNAYMNNTFEKHAQQLFIYGAILKKNFGAETVDFNIIPVSLDVDHIDSSKGIVSNVGPQEFIDVNSFVHSKVIREGINSDLKVEPSFKLTSDESIKAVQTYLIERIKNTEIFIKSTLENRTANIDVKELNRIANDLINVKGVDAVLLNVRHLQQLYSELREQYHGALYGAFMVSNDIGANVSIPTSRKTEFLNTINYLEIMTKSTNSLLDLKNIQVDGVNIAQDVIEPLNVIKGHIENFKNLIHKEILDDLAHKLVAKTNIGKLEFKRKYEKEFADINNYTSGVLGLTDNYFIGSTKVPKQAWYAARNRFVDSKIKENSDEIYNHSLKVAKSYVTKIPVDIDVEWKYLEAGEFNNYIIKYIYNSLKDLDIKRQQEFLKVRNNVVDRIKSIPSLSNNIVQFKSAESVFGKYIEGDHLVTMYKDDFLYGEGGYFDYLKEIKDFDNKIKTVLADNNTELSTNLHKAKENFTKAWMRENTFKIKDNSGKVKVFPATKYINPRYNEIKDDPTYKLLLELAISGDQLLESNKLKLGTSIFNTTFFKIPSLHKGTYENVVSGGIIDKVKNFWNGVTNIFTPNVDESDVANTNVANTVDVSNVLNELDMVDKLNVQQLNSDINNQVVPNINLPFRGMLGATKEEHTRRLSNDLIASYLANYDASYNYFLKAKVKDEYTLAVQALGNPSLSGTVRHQNSEQPGVGDRIADTIGLKRIKVVSGYLDLLNLPDDEKMFDQITENTEKKQRWVAALDMVMQQKLYGVKIEGNLNAHNAVNLINHLQAAHTLTANTISGIANFAEGIYRLFMESGVGNLVSFRSVLSAVTESVTKETVTDIYNQLNSPIPTTKNAALSEKYNTAGQLISPEYHILQKSKAFKLISLDSLNAVNNVVEGVLSNALLKSVLYELKVTNANGQYVNRAGEIVDSREKAASVAGSVGFKDNQLVYPDDLYLENGLKLNSLEADTFITRRISKLGYKSQGYYQRDATVKAKRQALGRLILAMKNWLLPSFNRKLKHFNHIGRLNKAQQFGYINYDEDAETTDVGVETQYFDFAVNSFRNHYNMEETANTALKLIRSFYKTIAQNRENFDSLDYDSRRRVITAKRIGLYMVLTDLINSLVKMLLIDDYDDEEEEAQKSKEYKAKEKLIVSKIETLQQATDPEHIELLKRDIDALISQLNNGIDSDAIKRYYFNDAIPKEVVNLNPSKYQKFGNSYYPKAMNVKLNEIEIFGISPFSSEKSILTLNPQRKHWDLIFTGALIQARIKDEAQSLSLLSTVNALTGGPSEVVTPITSAGKLLANPVAATGLLLQTEGFLNGVLGLTVTEPNDFYQQNSKSKEFENVHDHLKYTEKDDLFQKIFKHWSGSNYEKQYEAIYGKNDRTSK